jgi:molecular chaperone DnaK
MAHQVERQLRELGSRVPANERARAEQLISETQSLVKNNPSETERLRQLTSDLQQIAYALTAAASSQSSSGPSEGAGAGAGPQAGQTGDDDVIDAEFKRAG